MRILLCLALISLPALAIRPFTPEELLQTKRLDDVQASPDNSYVAFTVRQKSLGENRDLKDVWVLPVAGGNPRQLTRDGKSEHARWSPDGTSILVTSSRSGTPQLWLYEIAPAPGLSEGKPDAAARGLHEAPFIDGDPRQVTELSGGADGGVFSSDGRWIAFTSDVSPQCNGDDLCNRKLDADRASSKVQARITEHLFVRHWATWKEGKRSHLFVVAAPKSGVPSSPAPVARDLTPGDSDWPTFSLDGGDDYSFTSNGDTIIVGHKPAAHESWSTNSDLYAVPVASGTAKNLTEGNVGADEQPHVSPDGRYVAYLSQARDGYESDQWKLKLLDLHSGKTVVAGDFDDDVGAFEWRHDSKGLVAGRIQKGRMYIENVALDGRVTRYGTSSISEDFALLKDGSIIYVESGMNRPPELARAYPSERTKTLTGFNTEQYAGLDLGPAPEEIWAKAADGTQLQGWILKPPGLKSGVRAPLLVLIHGGPQGAWEDAWGMRWNPAAFAARGYVVVMPNPRGSIGYGHKFEEQIRDQWGGLPFDDIQRLVDAAEALPFVEAGRTCAAGASYGGYMIDWIAGHTDRYKCLVSHDGVFNLAAQYGSTEELWFPEFEFRGTPWENPDSYQKWSPSNFVQNFKTPTLVVQGEQDFRVPTEQGMGMFTALQRRGVESKLLWFPDEGHWVLKPRNSALWYHTVLDWIDAHLREAKSASNN